MTNDTPKDFVVSQQRLLLSAWSLDDDLWENWEDHRATLEKALKALATGRQREIKSHLNGPMATQLGDQLELLQEEHVDHKTRQQAQAGEVGKLAVGTEEPGPVLCCSCKSLKLTERVCRWYHSLIEEWPNAHPKAQGQRYKDLLARVKKLEKTKTSLTEQAQVYRVRLLSLAPSPFD